MSRDPVSPCASNLPSRSRGFPLSSGKRAGVRGKGAALTSTPEPSPGTFELDWPPGKAGGDPGRMTGQLRFPSRLGRLGPILAWLLFMTAFGLGARADDTTAAFDKANKLYEQSRFSEAVGAYQQLIQSGLTSPTMYYNLGNAFFKSGQTGRAIAAYRQAQTLSPRDPSILFNLQFARKKVNGLDLDSAAGWQSWLAKLTVNEWTVLAMGGFWLWFLLLALREYRPGLRKALQGYTLTAGVAALALGCCLALAADDGDGASSAVVTVQDAVVRYGPLDESPVHFQLRDGSEVSVLDEKKAPATGGNESWLQVRDSAQRVGWLKRGQVTLLGSLTLPK